MRKFLLVAAVAVLFGAGCGESDGNGDTGAAASPAPSASASVGAAGGADNTRQVCTEAKALGEEYKTKATDILTRALQPGVDEAKAEQILGEIVPLSKEYKTKFEALGARANNQQLKDALTVLAKDMDSASPDTAAETTGAAEETLTGICGE